MRNMLLWCSDSLSPSSTSYRWIRCSFQVMLKLASFNRCPDKYSSLILSKNSNNSISSAKHLWVTWPVCQFAPADGSYIFDCRTKKKKCHAIQVIMFPGWYLNTRLKLKLRFINNLVVFQTIKKYNLCWLRSVIGSKGTCNSFGVFLQDLALAQVHIFKQLNMVVFLIWTIILRIHVAKGKILTVCSTDNSNLKRPFARVYRSLP